MKALPINVYRHGKTDCTNHGISSRFNELLLVCPRGFVDVDPENPPENLAVLEKRHLFGRDVYSIKPYAKAEGVGWMMGGNYGATSDSRFSDMLGGMYGAVAIHDRDETQEQYDMLSH